MNGEHATLSRTLGRLALASTAASCLFTAAQVTSAEPVAPAPPPPAAATSPPVAPPPPAADTPSPSLPQPPNTQPADPYPHPPYPYPPYGYPYQFRLPRADGSDERPEVMPYESGPVPIGYKLEERVNLGLVIAGPSLFVTGYLFAAYIASEKLSSGGRPYGTLLVPLLGSFMFIPYAPGPETFIYVLDGLVQTAGVAMFIGGMLKRKKVLVRTGLTAYEPELLVGPGSIGMKIQF